MKNDKEYLFHYKRHLPHYHPADAVYFMTFRLYGSLPSQVVNELKNEYKIAASKMRNETEVNIKPQPAFSRNNYFVQFDKYLDRCMTQSDWLKIPEVAETVKEAIHHRDLYEYKLFAYTLMPNHVHMVFRINNNASPYNISNIIGQLKSFTAHKANQILSRNGSFWQQENYDHVVRSEMELSKTIEYILNNPVKAGLSGTWEQYPYSYSKL